LRESCEPKRLESVKLFRTKLLGRLEEPREPSILQPLCPDANGWRRLGGGRVVRVRWIVSGVGGQTVLLCKYFVILSVSNVI
jgi:hypothetical protein